MTTPLDAMTEFEFIAWLRARAPHVACVRVGIGDDSAVLDLQGRDCLVTADSVVAGVHFDPQSTPAEKIGRKALARAVSDIAAMAGIPLAVVACVMLPHEYPAAEAQQMYEGMEKLARECGAAIVGGDITGGAAQLALAVTVIGCPGNTPPVLRSGARAGDRIFVTGRLGGSILGHHLEFSPRVREAQSLARQVPLHAMIDISDGLAADLSHILEESRCGAVLRAHDIPIATAAQSLATTSGRSPLEHALSDGEDYELLFTVAEADAMKVPRTLPGNVPVTDIGQIVAEPGLWLEETAGQRVSIDTALRNRGWLHKIRR